MNINFEKTAYLAAIKENPKFNDNQKILDFVKRELKFKYADVSHQKFNEKYSSEGWFGRKVIALPAAVCSVLVKTIYHLAKAIFIGFSEDEKYFQAQWFCIGRDFQEGFGRLVSLFNDRYGQYHIQASGFHKSCYEVFLSSRGASTTPSPSFSIPSPYLYNPPRTQPFSQPNFPNSFNDLYQASSFDDLYAAMNRRVVPRVSEVPYVPPYSPIQKTSISNTDLDREFKEIKSSWDTTTKTQRFEQLAKTYLKRGDPDNALKTIKEIYFDNETKDPVIVKIADAFLKRGEREKALKAIKEIYFDCKLKNDFIVKLALSYCDEAMLNKDPEVNLDKAFKTIQEIYFDNDVKDPVIVKIADAFLKQGEREKALKAIKEISFSSKIKNDFIAKLALSYFNEAMLNKDLEANLDKALKTIKEIYFDDKTKDPVIVKIAAAFLNHPFRGKALSTISELSSTCKEKTPLFILLAQSFFRIRDEDGVLKVIKEIVNDLLFSKMAHDGNGEIFLKIQINNYKAATDFISKQADICYAQTKQYFVIGNTKAILTEIAIQVTLRSTLQAFLNLAQPRVFSQGSNFFRQGPPPNGQSSTSEPKATPSKPNDPYTVLGLQPTASQEEIKKKYKELILIYHADKVLQNPKESDSDFEERKSNYSAKFLEIQEAFAKLK